MEIRFQDLILRAQAQVSAASLDEQCIRISCEWQTEEAPVLELAWEMPIADLHYCWHPHCRKNRCLPPDWGARFDSRVSSGAPVICLYNLLGMNRMTASLSDALSESSFHFGVCEETGMLDCRIRIRLDGHGGSYSAILRRDCTDCRYEEALRRAGLWWETFYPPMAVPSIAREPIYSAWYSYHQHTIAEDLEAECAQAVRDGFGCIIVDDGWQTLDTQRGYAYCGDWEPLKIPDMRAHVARVHQLGMKYMLWYSVPFVGKHSKAFARFEKMQLTMIDHHEAAVLDPRYPEVRQYLTGIYEKAMKEWDLDGFKLDFIDSFCATRNAPPFAPDMDCRTVEEAVVRLMNGVRDALQRIKPDALIEFRQSYTGPAMRLYGNMFRVGDCPDDPLSNRVGMVDLRLLLGQSAVHSDMLMWHPQESVENAAVQIQNVLFSVPQISVRLAELPENHRRMLRFWMDFIREHRSLLAAPIQAEMPQQLYPLVRTEKDGESVVAVYAAGHTASLGKAALTFLINASDPRGVVAESASAFRAVFFNCLGEKTGAGSFAAGLHRLPVPLGGYARLIPAEAE